MLTLEQIRDFPTVEEALEEMKGLLEDGGFVVDDWKEGTFQETILQLTAFFYSTMAERASVLSKQCFNDTSEGDALTALADSHFDNQRIPAVETVGDMQLTLATGNGPYTWAIGELQVKVNDQFSFFNATTGTISLGTNLGHLTMSFVAEQAGEQYNVDAGSDISLVTNFNGITVTNNAPEDASSDTWITTFGVDEEADSKLRTRNTTKWSTLATGETVRERVEQIALSASAGVFGVYVDDQNPRGAGTVDAYVGGELLTAGSDEVTAVQYALTGAFFNGSSRIQTIAASTSSWDRTIIVYYRPTFTVTEMQSALSGALDTFISEMPIGGNDYAPGPSNIASMGDLYAALEDLDGVRKISLSDSSDIDLYPSTLPLKLTKPGSGWTSPILQLTASTV